MLEGQTNIFEMLFPTYKITKPIRLITLFSGYDSQTLALKYLGVKFEHYKTCEWAIKSIQALKDLHFGEDNTDYSKELTSEEIKSYLIKKGISSNWNDPMSKEQVSRLNEKQVRTIYNNIKATHNLVNIQQVKGEDLEIKDTDKFTYLLTYSFPCQDLSLAGKGKGMSDTTTRSGMLWEVERILTECKEKPQILLMENVPQVHGEGNKEDFNKWQLRLEELGYSNYWQDLIATDYGIPQTRNRCFMISILGDYNYTFPKPIPLKLKLKDMLEENVDNKYYLSKKMIKSIEEKVKVIDIYKEDTKNILNYSVENNTIFDCRYDEGLRIRKDGNCSTLTTRNINCISGVPIVIRNKKMSFLTPKEYFRLMGVKDEDYEKVKKNQSDSSLYHLAGDSIVVNVLMAIFKELIEK